MLFQYFEGGGGVLLGFRIDLNSMYIAAETPYICVKCKCNIKKDGKGPFTPDINYVWTIRYTNLLRFTTGEIYYHKPSLGHSRIDCDSERKLFACLWSVLSPSQSPSFSVNDALVSAIECVIEAWNTRPGLPKCRWTHRMKSSLNSDPVNCFSGFKAWTGGSRFKGGFF